MNNETNDIPSEYLDKDGVLNDKGLARYKSGADFGTNNEQVDIDEPAPRRID